MSCTIFRYHRRLRKHILLNQLSLPAPVQLRNLNSLLLIKQTLPQKTQKNSPLIQPMTKHHQPLLKNRTSVRQSKTNSHLPIEKQVMTNLKRHQRLLRRYKMNLISLKEQWKLGQNLQLLSNHRCPPMTNQLLHLLTNQRLELMMYQKSPLLTNHSMQLSTSHMTLHLTNHISPLLKISRTLLLNRSSL